MFDKLIESQSGNDARKNRSSYFAVSGLLMSVLLMTGLVVGIYADEISLVADTLDTRSLIAPADLTPQTIKEELPKPQRSSAPSSSNNVKIAVRTANIARTDEPTAAPTAISTNAKVFARPNTDYKLGSVNSDPGGPSVERGNSVGSIGSNNTTAAFERPKQIDEEESKDLPKPTTTVKQPEKSKAIQSLGVINGKALLLPQPIVSAAARAMHLNDKVTVQVMIDENGRVISTTAIDGHPLLRASAEKAARSATFSPTLLSRSAVKVKGVIVYNFQL